MLHLHCKLLSDADSSQANTQVAIPQHELEHGLYILTRISMLCFLQYDPMSLPK